MIFSILETDSASTPFEVTHNALNRKSAVPAEDLAQVRACAPLSLRGMPGGAALCRTHS